MHSDSEEIFARLFQVSNRLQKVLDKSLQKDKLTFKQLYTMIAIYSFGKDSPPSYREVADISGTSYQNVTQILIKLESRGFIVIESDPNDKRTKRLKLTNKANQYWSNRSHLDLEMLRKLFYGFDDCQLTNFNNSLYNLSNNLKQLEDTQ